MIAGVPVEVDVDGERRADRVRLVDFDTAARNRFLVVSQLTIQGSKGLRRPDLVCYLNGLPVAVVELKSATAEQADIWSAYHQLRTYQDEIPDLFAANAALVISDGVHARVGALGAPRERFLPWRTLRDQDDRPLLEFELEKVVRGFFAPDLFLEYLRDFILFEQADGRLTKKIAGYHQFHGVREAMRAVTTAVLPARRDRVREARATWGRDVPPGSHKGGIFWHTQGSGKSLSMVFLAGKLLRHPALQNPTVVVVTDRDDLDEQLYQTFAGAADLLGERPERATDRGDLRTRLAGRASGGIIFTTIQMFLPGRDEERFPAINARENVVVIADEAHRSQYGTRATLDRATGRYRYGYARHMRDALPNATFVGFTGTPIEGDDRDTRDVFGDYVSIYDIQDAVDDGATVPIYYESRANRLDLDPDVLRELDEVGNAVAEYEEELPPGTAEAARWVTLERLVGSASSVRQMAADIVQHFEARRAAIEGKGMIVGMSRDICARLYEEIVRLRPEWHHDEPGQGAIKVVMTGSAADPPHIQRHLVGPADRRLVERRFRDPDDPLRLVIVRDMWLTGFDVPPLHTLYVGKPMQGHALMQAIARVNRVFRDKAGGLVVDYVGIAGELRRALRTYTEARGKGRPAQRAEEALVELRRHLDSARGMLHGFLYHDYRTNAVALLLPAANHVLGQDDGARRWGDAVVAISKAYALCGTLDEAAELREEVAFFQAVRAVIAKTTTPERTLAAERKDSVIRQILDRAVVAGGVEDVLALAGIARPDLSVLSDAFLAEVRALPQRNLAVELLQRLMRDAVRARGRTNVVVEERFGKRLQDVLNRYRARMLESAQVIEELIAMARDFREEAQRGAKLGLNDAELAFYDALADHPGAARDVGEATLQQIAVELTEKLQKSASVDWQKRESVRARLRNLVRITLRRHRYPPEGQEAAIQLVLDQAERLSDAWTSAVTA